MHCVDCARTAARSRPTVRTVTGGVDRGGPPVITYTIMAICVAIELLRYLAPPLYGQIFSELVFWPAYGAAEPYRFLTSTLLHGGIWHLAFNMYALYLVGGQLERMLGRSRYLALYLLAAVGGSVAYLLIAGVDAVGAVGASGGVFGLFGAFAVLMRKFGGDTRQILVIIGINAVLGFVIGGIAWQAHLGGLVVGAALAALYAYAPREREWLQWVGSGAVLVLLAGVSAAVLA
ncbi:rhomboid family intramembrane serine protease [Serinibacter arcticus]|uniref:rhomboid family intramembrane serine protease n=1 Tax=Serinibacter arcticus TaxID=1655435 RepID=UPI002E26ED5E